MPSEKTQSDVRVRLLVGALTPLILAALGQAIYAISAQHAAMMEGLESRASSLATLMIDVAGPSLALDDDAAVESSLGYLAADPDFGFALVSRVGGKVVGFRGPESQRSTLTGAYVQLTGKQRTNDFFITAAPISFEHRTIGRIVLGLRTAQVNQAVGRIVLRTGLISAVGGIAAVVVVLLLARRIVQRNRDMRLLLGSIDQGLVTVNLDGTTSPERSDVAEKWIGPWIAGRKVWDDFAAVDPELGDWMRAGWVNVTSDALPVDVAIDQLPHRITFGRQTVEIEYKALLEGEALRQMLMVLTDITPRLERERADNEQRELMAICRRVAEDQQGLLEFCRETDHLVELILTSNPGRQDLWRYVHTLKGNCSLYGLTSVTSVCHEVENELTDPEAPASCVGRACAAWQAAKDRFSVFLEKTDLPGIELTEVEHQLLLQAVSGGMPREELMQRIAALALEPTRGRLYRFGEQARSIAERLGKAPVKVIVEDNQLRLDGEHFSPFWSTFSHVVRNAVDHGVETAEERVTVGKPEAATLTVRSFEQKGEVVIEIEDDGRGIDWARVAEKARGAGLDADTAEDLEEALFTDGLSTVEHANEFSGRGVGLAAVRAACVALGGRVAIRSVPGAGTRMTFSWSRTDLEEQSTRRAS